MIHHMCGITCAGCGTTFTGKPSRKFCSHACYAVALRERRKGEANPSWRGGISYSGHGYRLILVGKGEPMANNNGYVPEHRLVMAEHLGRPLKRSEHVHHCNGDILDNRLENLEILSLSDHTKHHNRGKSRKLDPVLAQVRVLHPVRRGRPQTRGARSLYALLRPPAQGR